MPMRATTAEDVPTAAFIGAEEVGPQREPGVRAGWRPVVRRWRSETLWGLFVLEKRRWTCGRS